MEILDNGSHKVIAFYLPQFHPTPDNDKWYGKGFTEWTNVGKAKPLFPGHYQPKVPADLGYYDLRLPAVRELQVQLAHEAGVYGFCYYHYWFGNGKRELELPFNEVLESGKPDFPFMLCWANETWHKKFWNLDGSFSSNILVEQTYSGDEDIIKHFEAVLPAFKDSRYITIDGKPVFMIYKENLHPDIKHFIEMWQDLALKNGLKGIFFISHEQDVVTPESIAELKSKNFNAVNYTGFYNVLWSYNPYRFIPWRIKEFYRKIRKYPIRLPYKEYINRVFNDIEKNEFIIPTIYPNWDHTPRSGSGGLVLEGSTPELFKQLVGNILKQFENNENKLIFLKSWNEWGEGNYMEPDMKFGHGYLKALRDALNDNTSQHSQS